VESLSLKGRGPGGRALKAAFLLLHFVVELKIDIKQTIRRKSLFSYIGIGVPQKMGPLPPRTA
jgi:hypothetical protein